MFELKSIKLYKGNYGEQFGYDTGGVMSTAIAFQQGDKFNPVRDIAFFLVYSRTHQKTVMLTSIYGLNVTFDMEDGFECLTSAAGAGCAGGAFAEQGISGLLQTMNAALTCKRIMTENRRYVSRMNAVTGSKRKSRWAEWFNCVLRTLNALIVSELNGINQRCLAGEKIHICSTNRFLIDLSTGMCNYHHPDCGEKSWYNHWDDGEEWHYQFFSNTLVHTDRATGKCDYLYDVSINGECFTDDAGGSPAAAPATAAEEPAAPAKVLAVSVDERTAAIYRLIRQAAYMVLESEQSNGAEYLKVMNDCGEEVWLNRDKTTAVATE